MNCFDQIIHIFWTNIPESLRIHELKDHLSILDNNEIYKLNRIVSEDRKVEFVVGRILLKNMVGSYLGIPSQEINFLSNEFGKPYLGEKVYLRSRFNSVLHINLSHTRRLVACVISPLWAVGIDVEHLTNNHLEAMTIAFTNSEVKYVNSFTTKRDQIKAFYEIWTRKEAVIKAEGKGFSIHPKSFTVPFHSQCDYDNKYIFFTFQPDMESLISVALCKYEKFKCEPEYEMKKISLEKLLGESK